MCLAHLLCQPRRGGTHEPGEKPLAKLSEQKGGLSPFPPPGDGHNRNAQLTVFRHFDNATVVRGFLGAQCLHRRAR